MKNQQKYTNLSQNSMVDPCQNSFICQMGNVSIHCCFRKDCTISSLVCQSRECPCNQKHKKCIFVKTQSILRSIEDRRIDLSSIEKLINKRIDKIIDEISDYRDQILFEIEQRYQGYGLTDDQTKVLQAAKQNQFKQVSGQMLWNAYENDKLNILFENKIQKTVKQIESSFDQFEKQWSKLNIQVQQILKKLKTPNQLVCGLNQSKILTSQSEIDTLKQFFSHFKRTIKSVSLLYRASQNEFLVSKFHQKCDNISGTLILCETEFNKKIGGYTLIPWQHIKQTFKKDESKQSFLFSVTHNDLLLLNQPQKATYHYCHPKVEFGPRFGGGADFNICDKANLQMKSYAYPGYSYRNGNYQSSTKESYKRFSGNETNAAYFKVKEWQVWRMELE